MDSQMAEAFHLIPYGIYVLTTRGNSQPVGMIVSWVSQVSYSPPLLMVALRRNRPAIPAIQQKGVFSLSLMKKGQGALISRFKEPDFQPGFSELLASTGPDMPPFLKGALASWRCRLFSTVEAGDHILFIGEVQSVSADPGGQPLTTGDYGKNYIGQV